MTHWRSRSKVVLSARCYYLVPPPLSAERLAWNEQYLRDSERKRLSASRFTTHARAFLRRSVLAILLAMGLAYAICSMLAEYTYAQGTDGSGTVGQQLSTLKLGAKLFPLERRFRTAPAKVLGNIVLQASPEWKLAALPELKAALDTDPTQADLLAMIVSIDLSLDRTEEAQAYYDQFKLVAKSSPLNGMVGK